MRSIYVKAPFLLSISDTVTLKYSHARERDAVRNTRRVIDESTYWTWILNVDLWNESKFVLAIIFVPSSDTRLPSLARTALITVPFIRSKLPRYRLFRDDKRARNWDVASRGSPTTLKSVVTGTMQRNKLHITLSAFIRNDQSRDAKERVPQIDLARTQSFFRVYNRDNYTMREWTVIVVHKKKNIISTM